MSKEFPANEFDSWAESYDSSIDEPGFPFEGYSSVLETIVDRATLSLGMEVLDLGAGTGNLSILIHKLGCRLWCLDFSLPMLEILRQKLPQAVTAHADIRGEWPPEFRRRYDRIVSAYTFHHFPLEEKVKMIQHLSADHLVPGGKIVIGDLAFRDQKEKDTAQKLLRDEWDDEYYWLADETMAACTQAGFHAQFSKVSRFAGVFLID